MVLLMMIGYLVEGVVREEEPQRGLGAICRHALLADALVPVIRAAEPDLFPVEVVGSPVGLLPHLAAQGCDLESTLLLCGELQPTLPKSTTQDNPGSTDRYASDSRSAGIVTSSRNAPRTASH